MGDKKRKNKKQRRKNVEGSSKKGKLPSSVQALLGYLGGGGPTPMYQQPVNVQRERAGVDSVETLSQIIRQQNLMNASYMQNMERLAFKNEIQDQLKKQGEEQKKEIKEAREEQKQEIKNVVVQTQEATKEAIQATTERSLDQERKSMMRSINYYKGKNKPDKLQFYQEQLRLIDGSIRNKSLADLQNSIQYKSPFATQAPSYSNLAPADVSQPNLFNFGGIQQRVGPALFNTPVKPAVTIDEANVDNIVQRLPALDPNAPLEQQLRQQTKQIRRAVNKQAEGGSATEIRLGLNSFASVDALSSSGTSSRGKFTTSSKLPRTPN